jgi:pyruvate/2-oxoglutarate dehydrogenase complex dihydrolipoamide acyltransferase (E2) component
MSVEVLMPVVSDDADEGVVTAWLVEPGSLVSEGQVIAEAQTEKVSVDVIAPQAGVVERLLVRINEPVRPGTPICLIGEATSPPPPETGAPAPAPEVATGAGAGRAPGPPASPAARRAARELGVDLTSVKGTGAGGRITEEDVRAAARGSA